MTELFPVKPTLPDVPQHDVQEVLPMLNHSDNKKTTTMLWLKEINKTINGNFSGFHRVALSSTVSRSKFGNVDFCGMIRKKKKNPWGRERTPNSTHTCNTGNLTQATQVSAKCSHHCAIPAPNQCNFFSEFRGNYSNSKENKK